MREEGVTKIVTNSRWIRDGIRDLEWGGSRESWMKGGNGGKGWEMGLCNNVNGRIIALI